ncbi:MAG TPA: RNA-binding S4 domain-containing protein [Blastocatellia bacterium]
MRLDVFLKLSRLVPRRSIAQKMCEAGTVSVNGTPAKSSREVKIGDELTVKGKDRTIKAKVTDIPARPPSKALASTMYQVISETPNLEDWGPG